MVNEINIGDVFYKVNKDDRKSIIEQHRFIHLEVTSITKDNNIWAFGINNCPIDLYQFIKRNGKDYDGNINKFDVLNREKCQVAVIGTTMAEVKNSLEEALQCKIYSDKESSKEELKNLLGSELNDINIRIEDLLEYKTILEKRLKTYE